MQTLKYSVQKDLLTAARAIFLRKGFQKTSMRDIAQASGICLSNIYNYFKSKILRRKKENDNERSYCRYAYKNP